MVGEEPRPRGLRTGADIPPDLLVERLPCARRLLDIVVQHRAPDVHEARQRALRLLGQHPADIRGVLVKQPHPVGHVLVVLRCGLIHPVRVSLVEPALLAQMLLQRVQVLADDPVILGRALRVWPDRARGVAAWHVADRQAEALEAQAIHVALQPAVPVGEVHHDAHDVGAALEAAIRDEVPVAAGLAQCDIVEEHAAGRRPGLDPACGAQREAERGAALRNAGGWNLHGVALPGAGAGVARVDVPPGHPAPGCVLAGERSLELVARVRARHEAEDVVAGAVNVDASNGRGRGTGLRLVIGHAQHVAALRRVGGGYRDAALPVDAGQRDLWALQPCTVRVNAVLAEVAHVRVPHRLHLLVGLQVVVLPDGAAAEAHRGDQRALGRHLKVPHAQLNRHLRAPAVGLQRQPPAVVSGRGIARHVHAHPQRLVLAGREIDWLIERWQRIGPPANGALRIGRRVHIDVAHAEDVHLIGRDHVSIESGQVTHTGREVRERLLRAQDHLHRLILAARGRQPHRRIGRKRRHARPPDLVGPLAPPQVGGLVARDRVAVARAVQLGDAEAEARAVELLLSLIHGRERGHVVTRIRGHERQCDRRLLARLQDRRRACLAAHGLPAHPQRHLRADRLLARVAHGRLHERQPFRLRAADGSRLNDQPVTAQLLNEEGRLAHQWLDLLGELCLKAEAVDLEGARGGIIAAFALARGAEAQEDRLRGEQRVGKREGLRRHLADGAELSPGRAVCACLDDALAGRVPSDGDRDGRAGHRDAAEFVAVDDLGAGEEHPAVRVEVRGVAHETAGVVARVAARGSLVHVAAIGDALAGAERDAIATDGHRAHRHDADVIEEEGAIRVPVADAHVRVLGLLGHAEDVCGLLPLPARRDVAVGEARAGDGAAAGDLRAAHPGGELVECAGLEVGHGSAPVGGIAAIAADRDGAATGMPIIAPECGIAGRRPAGRRVHALLEGRVGQQVHLQVHLQVLLRQRARGKYYEDQPSDGRLHGSGSSTQHGWAKMRVRDQVIHLFTADLLRLIGRNRAPRREETGSDAW